MSQEWIDPVIDEIHEVRLRISARCGHDPDRLVAYYMERQQRHEDRLVDRFPATIASDRVPTMEATSAI